MTHHRQEICYHIFSGLKLWPRGKGGIHPKNSALSQVGRWVFRPRDLSRCPMHGPDLRIKYQFIQFLAITLL